MKLFDGLLLGVAVLGLCAVAIANNALHSRDVADLTGQIVSLTARVDALDAQVTALERPTPEPAVVPTPTPVVTVTPAKRPVPVFSRGFVR